MPTNQLNIVTALTCLAQDPRRIRSISADINRIGSRSLQLLDDCRVVGRPRHVGQVEDLLNTILIQLLPHLLRQAHAIGAAIVQNCDCSVPPTIGQEVTGDPALNIVTPDQAKDIAPTFLGKLRMALCRGHHGDAGGLVERGRHQRGVRA